MTEKKIWETRFRISKENQEELLGICDGYEDVDETFTYKISGHAPSFVVILSSDEKQAFRRGMSIKRKLIKHGVKPAWFKLREAKD